MPRKKSIKRASEDFVFGADDILAFLVESAAKVPPEYQPWLYDHAIVRLYRYFESLVLDVLVGAINQDTSTISSRVGVEFPRHLSQSVCEYLVVGDRYFDFRGRDGLIKQLRRFVPETHYLVMIVKQPKYRAALEELIALRNFAAHGSWAAKNALKHALGVSRIRCAGAWVRGGGRFQHLANRLKELAEEIGAAAPY